MDTEYAYPSKQETDGSIDSLATRLSVAFKELNECLGVLTDRLATVLRPESGLVAATMAETVDMVRSPLSRQLADSLAAADRLRSRLAEITNRVDL